jgi:hypothetical protein
MKFISVVASLIVGNVIAGTDRLRQEILSGLENPVTPPEFCNCSSSCYSSGDPHVTGFGATKAVTVRLPDRTNLTYYDTPVFNHVIFAEVRGTNNNNDAAWNAIVYETSSSGTVTIANAADCTQDGVIAYRKYTNTTGIQEQILEVTVSCVYASGVNIDGKHYRLDIIITKNDVNIGFNNFLEFEESAGPVSGDCFEHALDPGNSICTCNSIPTPKPTLPFVSPCDCHGKCKMLHDPYVWNFNQNKEPYYGDNMWHSVYEYDIYQILAQFTKDPNDNSKQWTTELTVNDILYDTSMCWNDWSSAPKNCATRSGNARYSFPQIIVISPSGESNITVDVHCVCKSRINTPNNTRLDTWINVYDSAVPPASSSSINAMLDYQVNGGGTGMCFPGYKSGTLSVAETPNSPTCNCPVQ